MGKYKRLKNAHDELRKDFSKLLKALKAEGSLSPHCDMCNDYIGGSHKDKIRCAQVDANTALFRVGTLAKFFGLDLKHIEINEWKYIERTDTDE